MAEIGIRLADGQFYPVLSSDLVAKKRLILTTVRDKQPSVQIDMYRSSQGKEAYIGSLIIENIASRPKGEPDIRLELGLDDKGELNAYARDESSGEHQTLTVSLQSLSEEEKYEIPDFDFQEDEDFDFSVESLPSEESGAEAVQEFSDAEAEEIMPDEITEAYDDEDFDIGPEEELTELQEKPDKETFIASKSRQSKGVSALLVGILAALGTALILLSAFFIYRCTSSDKAVMEQELKPVEVVKLVQEAPPAKAAETPPQQEAAKPQEAAQAAPVQSETPKEAGAAQDAAPEKKGIWHKIKWGDTLWDISLAYYRNPWLYKTIAKANNIKNPDLIISGTWIFIPPR